MYTHECGTRTARCCPNWACTQGTGPRVVDSETPAVMEVARGDPVQTLPRACGTRLLGQEMWENVMLMHRRVLVVVSVLQSFRLRLYLVNHLRCGGSHAQPPTGEHKLGSPFPLIPRSPPLSSIHSLAR